MHGNRQDESKTVKVQYACAPGTIKVRVRDEGNGFDVACLLDPTDPERCMCCSGRGIYIMRHVMDSVEFEMSNGTTVTMTKGVG